MPFPILYPHLAALPEYEDEPEEDGGCQRHLHGELDPPGGAHTTGNGWRRGRRGSSQVVGGSWLGGGRHATYQSKEPRRGASERAKQAEKETGDLKLFPSQAVAQKPVAVLGTTAATARGSWWAPAAGRPATGRERRRRRRRTLSC